MKTRSRLKRFLSSGGFQFLIAILRLILIIATLGKYKGGGFGGGKFGGGGA